LGESTAAGPLSTADLLAYGQSAKVAPLDPAISEPMNLAARLQALATAADVRCSQQRLAEVIAGEMRVYGELFVPIAACTFTMRKIETWDNRSYAPGARVDRWRIPASILWGWSRGSTSSCIPAEEGVAA
jgi:hypothetical protein